MSETAVRDLFDDWARRGRAEGMERSHGPAARAAFDLLGVKSGQRYLDIGCGNGYTVRWAAKAGAFAHGIDVSSEMISRARESADERCTFAVTHFPIAVPSATFDAIFSMEVFYYLGDLDAGLSAVCNLLEPGGRFACVVDFFEENPDSHSWPSDLGLELQFLSAQGWAAAVRRAGMVVIEQRRLGERERSLCTLAQRE